MTGPNGSLQTPTQLAALLQMDRRALGRRLAGLTPAKTKGRIRWYALADVLQVLLRVEDGDIRRLNAARSRLAEIQAERQEVELAIRRGELLPRERVRQEWSRLVLAFRSRMLQVPRRLAFRIARAKPAAAEELLRAAIHEALDELAHNKRRRPRRPSKRTTRRKADERKP